MIQGRKLKVLQTYELKQGIGSNFVPYQQNRHDVARSAVMKLESIRPSIVSIVVKITAVYNSLRARTYRLPSGKFIFDFINYTALIYRIPSFHY